MISVIMPLGQRHRSPAFWLLRGALYIAATIGSGALAGALVALFGRLLAAAVPTPLLLGAGALLAVAYALHELGVWRVPRPEHAWAVPNEWILRRPLLGAVLFGLTIGAGIFTFIPFTSFYLLLAWEALTANPAAGALIGGTYGLARGLPVITGAVLTAGGRAIGPVHVRILQASPRLHRLTSGLLLLAAAVLCLPLLLGLAAR